MNWGRDLPEPAASPTSATSSPAIPRPTARARSRSRAASRSATCSSCGRKYSEAMNATFLDAAGKTAVMRDGLLRHRRDAHRRRGDRAEPRRARHRLARRRSRRWHVAIVPDRLRTRAPRCAKRPSSCTRELAAAGIDVLLDDRGVRPGAMFADMELIGIPHRVVRRERGLAAGTFEYRRRGAAENESLNRVDLMRRLSA